MAVIPTYEVLIKPQPEAETGLSFRVPANKLETFLSVLIFNGITSISMNVENHDVVAD